MSIAHAGEAVLIAVDFTAERLRLLMTDMDGEPIAREEWALPLLPDELAWSWEVGGRIATLFAREGGRRSALGIGVACPGSVDAISGRIIESTGQPEWDGLAVVDALRRHLDAPIAAVNRVQASLMAEAAQGSAMDASDVLYVSLRGIPVAALLSAGRLMRGANGGAGALPAMPELTGRATLDDATVQSITSVLADAAALLDPELVVLDADPIHLAVIVPLLQRVIQEVAPGPRVAAATLGEEAAVTGAVRIASTVAYEGARTA